MPPPKGKSGSESIVKLTCFTEGLVGKQKRKLQAQHPANVTLLPLYTSQLLFECISHRSYWFSLQAKCLQQNKASLKPEEASPSGLVCMPDSEQAFHLD